MSDDIKVKRLIIEFDDLAREVRLNEEIEEIIPEINSALKAAVHEGHMELDLGSEVNYSSYDLAFVGTLLTLLRKAGYRTFSEIDTDKCGDRYYSSVKVMLPSWMSI